MGISAQKFKLMDKVQICADTLEFKFQKFKFQRHFKIMGGFQRHFKITGGFHSNLNSKKSVPWEMSYR